MAWLGLGGYLDQGPKQNHRRCQTGAPNVRFDPLAESFSGFVESRVRKAPNFSWGAFEVIIAGWSDRDDAPAAHVLTGHAKEGWPAYRCRPVTRFQTPMGDISFRINRADPAGSGLKLMEEQRRKKFELVGGSKPVFAIGGFCQHTVVSRDGLSMKILKRWPDKIGQLIDPTAQ